MIPKTMGPERGLGLVGKNPAPDILPMPSHKRAIALIMMEEACSDRGLMSLESHHKCRNDATCWLIRELERHGNIEEVARIAVHLADFDGLFGFEPAHDDVKLIYRTTFHGRERFVSDSLLY